MVDDSPGDYANCKNATSRVRWHSGSEPRAFASRSAHQSHAKRSCHGRRERMRVLTVTAFDASSGAAAAARDAGLVPSERHRRDVELGFERLTLRARRGPGRDAAPGARIAWSIDGSCTRPRAAACLVARASMSPVGGTTRGSTGSSVTATMPSPSGGLANLRRLLSRGPPAVHEPLRRSTRATCRGSVPCRRQTRTSRLARLSLWNGA